MDNSFLMQDEQRWGQSTHSGAQPSQVPVVPTTLPPDQLWTLLQQNLLDARQRLAVAQETWKTACRARDDLDVRFNRGWLPDDEYDQERKSKAIEIQTAMKAILEASNKEKQLTDHLLIMRQAHNNRTPGALTV